MYRKRVPPPTSRVLLAALLLALGGCQDRELLTTAPADGARLNVTSASGIQNIVGIVIEGARLDDKGAVTKVEGNELRLHGIHVSFLDAFTAEQLGTVITTDEGAYDSGLLPIGNYRVRFSDPDGIDPLGIYLPEFYGAAGEDDFCAAQVVVVEASSTAMADAAMTHWPPFELVTHSGVVRGTVFDAATGAPIPGIRVLIRNAHKTMVEGVATTDADGSYEVALIDLAVDFVRVLFWDPAGAYLLAYHGEPATDLFCDAAVVPVETEKKSTDGFLQRVPLENLVEVLIETIDSFDLSDDVHAMLVTPLNRFTALLADENSDNDAAACGQLQAFLSRVDVQERRGQLSAEEAAVLREQTAALQAILGCD